MGDRTYCQVTCKESDRALFKEAGFVESCAEELQGLVNVEDDQANYGATSLLMDLSKQGIVFYGGHGSGCEYGPFNFASDGKQFADAPATAEGVVVGSLMDDKGRLRPVREAPAYFKVFSRARKLLEAESARVVKARRKTGKVVA